MEKEKDKLIVMEQVLILVLIIFIYFMTLYLTFDILFLLEHRGVAYTKKILTLLVSILIHKWSGKQDLNLQPLGPKPSALPS